VEYIPTYLQEYPVEHLTEEEGMELLQKQGVEATETLLRTAVTRCNGHPLSLTLLASILRQNRSLSLQTLLTDAKHAQLWKGRIAEKLLDYIYKQQLSELQRKLLLSFSVYREPVPLEAAEAILGEVSEDIFQALNVLLAQHLLQASG